MAQDFSQIDDALYCPFSLIERIEKSVQDPEDREAEFRTSTDFSEQPLSQLQTRIHHAIRQEFLTVVNQTHWRVISTIIEKMTKLGAIPYGGCVRDLVAREYGNQMYSHFCLSSGMTDAEKLTGYYDASVHPESYEQRTLLPEDIDVFALTQNQHTAIIDYLEQISSKYTVNDEVFGQYVENLDMNIARKLRLQKIKCSIFDSGWMNYLFMRSIFGVNATKKLRKNLKISIDLVSVLPGYENDIKKLYPPFNSPDFRCNLLTIESHGDFRMKISILPNTLDAVEALNRTDRKAYDFQPLFDTLCINESLENIFNDIKEKRAVLMSPDVPFARLEKMFKKGYKFEFSHCFKEMTAIETPSIQCPEICIICRDFFQADDKMYHFGCSCKAVYHLPCFLNSVAAAQSTHRCSMCRSDCPWYCKLLKFYRNIELVESGAKTSIQPQKCCSECNTCWCSATLCSAT